MIEDGIDHEGEIGPMMVPTMNHKDATWIDHEGIDGVDWIHYDSKVTD